MRTRQQSATMSSSSDHDHPPHHDQNNPLFNAYDSFHHALKIENENDSIHRELAGVCIELKKYDEAVEVAEHAAVLKPDNHTTLGTLALCYLFAGRLHESQKSIRAARKFHPANEINNRIAILIAEVAEGIRPLPETISELTTVAEPKKRFRDYLLFWRMFR